MSSSRLLLSLGHVLRRMRQSRGLTQAEVAHGANLSLRFVSDLEAGRANVSLLKLHDVARALDTTLAQIVAEAERGTENVPTAITLGRPLALVGLRGAGKSTVGRAVAAALSVPFVELDGLVEERAALGLQNLFEIHGDAYFRKVEAEALEDLLAKSAPCVIATGGSLVMHEKTWTRLRHKTMTVWLRASPVDHYTRVQAQGDLRPMSGRPHAMTELKRLLSARESHYKMAGFSIDTSKLTIAEVTEKLLVIARAHGADTSA